VPVSLTSAIVSNNIVLAGNSAIVGSAGVYLINYGINFATGAVVGNNISIGVNGVAVNGTSRQISSTSETSSSTILTLVAGAAVSIIPVANNLPVSGTGATSAHLSITRIA
jgi:hypothetical protein